MRRPIVTAASVFVVTAVVAACGGRDRVTVVTPPPPPAAPAQPAAAPAVVVPNPARFREYVITRSIPSHSYPGEVVVGVELPPAITFYEVPPEFGATQYRYALVNDRLVLVDPTTLRIVEIIG